MSIQAADREATVWGGSVPGRAIWGPLARSVTASLT